MPTPSPCLPGEGHRGSWLELRAEEGCSKDPTSPVAQGRRGAGQFVRVCLEGSGGRAAYGFLQGLGLFAAPHFLQMSAAH